jgi:hypothetical protein
MKKKENVMTVKCPIEAWKTRQEQVNKENDDFYKSLDPEDQKKIDAVGNAMKILTESGVSTLMFCAVKHKNADGEEFIQYNNSGELSDRDGLSPQDWWHKTTLGIYDYVCSLLRPNTLPKGFRVGELFESWFWSHVKPEYREAAKKKTEERQSNKIPAQ